MTSSYFTSLFVFQSPVEIHPQLLPGLDFADPDDGAPFKSQSHSGTTDGDIPAGVYPRGRYLWRSLVVHSTGPPGRLKPGGPEAWLGRTEDIAVSHSTSVSGS